LTSTTVSVAQALRWKDREVRQSGCNKTM